MPKKRGAKSKGRGKGSDYRRGYRTGWSRVENVVRGITPRRSRKGKVIVSKQSAEYRRGFYAGRAAARRHYK